jgi:hypothetical protein
MSIFAFAGVAARTRRCQTLASPWPSTQIGEESKVGSGPVMGQDPSHDSQTASNVVR